MARTKKSEVKEVVVDVNEVVVEEIVENKEMVSMSRANRITVVTNENGNLVGRFFLTHKLVAEVDQVECGWEEDKDAKATANRESFRAYLIKNADAYGVNWSPEKQTQAWDRKHNKYYEFVEVEEDTLTLVTPLIEKLVEKCKYELELDKVDVTEITPQECNLGYVEDGRYTSSGAWCVGLIGVSVDLVLGENTLTVELDVNMKSGQICKPKMTIAQWEERVATELDLRGIEVEVA